MMFEDEEYSRNNTDPMPDVHNEHEEDVLSNYWKCEMFYYGGGWREQGDK